MEIEILTKNISLANGQKFCKYLAKTNAGVSEIHFRKECGLPPEKHCIITVELSDINIKDTFYIKNGERIKKPIIWVKKWTLAQDSDERCTEIDKKRREQMEAEALDFLSNDAL